MCEVQAQPGTLSSVALPRTSHILSPELIVVETLCSTRKELAAILPSLGILEAARSPLSSPAHLTTPPVVLDHNQEWSH